MEKLIDLARVLRSKNAGPLYYTFDVMFDSREQLSRVLTSGKVNEKAIAELYSVAEKDVSIISYEIVNSFKITIPRTYVSGSQMEDDVYGCQQHRKLSEILIP